MSIYDAAERYRAEGTPLVVLAGKEYGTGSSRDWAAKGTLLLGVRAVIAESYERIHRSNLVGHGRPAAAVRGRARAPRRSASRASETFDDPRPRRRASRRARSVTVEVERAGRHDGSPSTATARLDTPVEVDYYRNGGILQTVLRKMLKG